MYERVLDLSVEDLTEFGALSDIINRMKEQIVFLEEMESTGKVFTGFDEEGDVIYLLTQDKNIADKYDFEESDDWEECEYEGNEPDDDDDYDDDDLNDPFCPRIRNYCTDEDLEDK